MKSLVPCIHVLLASLVLFCFTESASGSAVRLGDDSRELTRSLQPSLSTHVDNELAKFSKLEDRPAILPSTSQIPKSINAIAAFTWVVLLGSAPVLIYRHGEKEVTRSAIVLSCLMWLALFGGLILFTNIILFKSPHFESTRTLTVPECTYFMTQVITTVGYGDIVPAKTRGKVFVGIYVVFAFFVIAMLVSEMQQVVVAKMEKYKEELKQKAGEFRSGQTPPVMTSTESARSMNTERRRTRSLKPLKPSPADLFTSIGMFAVVALIWVLFFHLFPGENKPWLECCYMSLITLSTVGFGAVTPSTEGGMLFSSFFMFIGTSALVNVVGKLSSFIIQMDEWETWRADKFHEDLKNHMQEKLGSSLEDGGNIPEAQFLAFALIHKKLVNQDDIDVITETYHSLHRGRSKVPIEEIVASLEAEDDSSADHVI